VGCSSVVLNGKEEGRGTEKEGDEADVWTSLFLISFAKESRGV